MSHKAAIKIGNAGSPMCVNEHLPSNTQEVFLRSTVCPGSSAHWALFLSELLCTIYCSIHKLLISAFFVLSCTPSFLQSYQLHILPAHNSPTVYIIPVFIFAFILACISVYPEYNNWMMSVCTGWHCMKVGSDSWNLQDFFISFFIIILRPDQ